MANEVGPLLGVVGEILAQDTAYPLDGTFLYVEADWQMVDISIFKDLGDHLLYRDGMAGLAEALLNVWYAETPEKRWTSMQYRIRGESFDASFSYDSLDDDESTGDRRLFILNANYGNKRIVYPTFEEILAALPQS